MNEHQKSYKRLYITAFFFSFSSYNSLANVSWDNLYSKDEVHRKEEWKTKKKMSLEEQKLPFWRTADCPFLCNSAAAVGIEV